VAAALRLSVQPLLWAQYVRYGAGSASANEEGFNSLLMLIVIIFLERDAGNCTWIPVIYVLGKKEEALALLADRFKAASASSPLYSSNFFSFLLLFVLLLPRARPD
jgi:hypothetical protein